MIRIGIWLTYEKYVWWLICEKELRKKTNRRGLVGHNRSSLLHCFQSRSCLCGMSPSVQRHCRNKFCGEKARPCQQGEMERDNPLDCGMDGDEQP